MEAMRLFSIKCGAPSVFGTACTLLVIPGHGCYIMEMQELEASSQLMPPSPDSRRLGTSASEIWVFASKSHFSGGGVFLEKIVAVLIGDPHSCGCTGGEKPC